MEMDDEVCLCFHITKRKLTNYLRIEPVARASQLSQCGGAGTGCGWCVPFLQRMFDEARGGRVQTADVSKNDAETEDAPGKAAAPLPDAKEYALGRKSHIQQGKGRPPSP